MGGLIGVATDEKNGLMSSKDKKSILGGYDVGNKTFIKILSSDSNWQRKSALIYGDYNGAPYMVLIGMYTQLPSVIFYVRWITEKVNMLRFYKKENSINAFFDLSISAPHNAFIQSIEGIEFISIGVEPSSEYTEITT